MLLYEDVRDLAEMLEFVGRTPARSEWVDEIRTQVNESSLEGLL